MDSQLSNLWNAISNGESSPFSPFGSALDEAVLSTSGFGLLPLNVSLSLRKLAAENVKTDTEYKEEQTHAKRDVH